MGLKMGLISEHFRTVKTLELRGFAALKSRMPLQMFLPPVAFATFYALERFFNLGTLPGGSTSRKCVSEEIATWITTRTISLLNLYGDTEFKRFYSLFVICWYGHG